MRSSMKMLVKGFFDEFNQQKEPRMEKNKLYPMNEWIFTACAVICGAKAGRMSKILGKAKSSI